MDIHVSGNHLSFNGKTYVCAIGKGGYGKAIEGDHKTPAGVFSLRECWYRADKIIAPKTALKLRIISHNDGWCDDAKAAEYNSHVLLPFAHGHEKLWREDGHYDLVIPVGYNDGPIVPGRGSAIFIHIASDGYGPTEGCVALAKADLLEILPGLSAKTRIHLASA